MSEVIRGRGLRPSDRFDPGKRSFLNSLTRKILHLDLGRREGSFGRDVQLDRAFRPANEDFHIERTSSKNVYSSSDFYSPTHPTLGEEVAKAREISSSLTARENVSSKGHSMFVKRKKKAVKWVTQGQGQGQAEPPVDETHTPRDIVGEIWHGGTGTYREIPSSETSIFGKRRKKFEQFSHSNSINFPLSPQARTKVNEEWFGGDEVCRRSYNTAPRGYTLGQTVYHPVFLS